jgi:glycosyltransferase involved in cell wall biosynthesis
MNVKEPRRRDGRLMADVVVVIPAFNPGPHLSEAVASVISQSYAEWAAIVVDDGSSEDLSYVELLDPRIVVLRQENAGLSAARNAGIRATSEPLIAFLDTDDLWLPSKLERQVAALEGSAVLCSTDFEMIDGRGTRIGSGYGGAASFVDLLEGNGLCVSTVMVRRSALERVGLFDLRFQQAQDWDLWLRLACTGPFARCEEVLAQYRMHSSNMSLNYKRLLDEGTTILRGHAASADQESRAAARRGLRRLRRLAGAQAYDAFRNDRQLVDLIGALRLAPLLTLRQMRLFVARRL